jgi:hypothetical protein
MLDAFPEAVITVDTTEGSTRLSANSACTALLGVDVTGAALNPKQPLFDARRPDGSPVAARELPLERAFRNGERILGESLLIRNVNNDSFVPVVADAVPWRSMGGQIEGAVTTMRASLMQQTR